MLGLGLLMVVDMRFATASKPSSSRIVVNAYGTIQMRYRYMGKKQIALDETSFYYIKQ